MTLRYLKVCLAAAVLAFGWAAAGVAGDLAVDGEPFLFIPPVFTDQIFTDQGVADQGVAGQVLTGQGVAGALGSGAQGGGAAMPVAVGSLLAPPFDDPARPPQSGTTAATNAVVQSLADVTAFCASLPQQEYAVDCLSDGIATVARGLPATGDYADAKAVLGDMAGKLGALAAANADPVLPRGVATSAPTSVGAAGKTSSRPLTPVRTAVLPAVNAQATVIIEEAQTLLLRSAGSDRRALDYQRISAAVGSNKVLLRSA